MRIILFLACVFTFFGLILTFSSYDRVPEGNVGIVTEWGQAAEQIGPGFMWKNPISEDVVVIDVRERRSSETMSVSAQGVPMSAVVSFNWAVRPDAARRIFVEYGSIEEFEARAVLPIFNQAVKSAFGATPVNELIYKRTEVAARIEAGVVMAMERLPITVASLQIDDFTPPQGIMDAAEARVRSEQETEAAKQRLQLQAVEIQQQVQSAEAEAKAAKARSEAKLASTKAEAEGNLALSQAEAEGLRLVGEAKADAMRAEAAALEANPALVELERARRWSGAVPSIVMGDSSGAVPFLDIARIRESVN